MNYFHPETEAQFYVIIQRVRKSFELSFMGEIIFKNSSPVCIYDFLHFDFQLLVKVNCRSYHAKFYSRNLKTSNQINISTRPRSRFET